MQEGGYFIIAIAFVLTLVSVYLMLWMVNKIAPKHDPKKEPARNDVYECGEKTIGDAKGPIHIQYYFVILMFTVFDVSIALIIPWAYAFRSMISSYGLMSFINVMIFLAMMLIGLLYAIKKGYMDWR